MLTPFPQHTIAYSWEGCTEAFLWSRKVLGVRQPTLDWHAVTLKLFRLCHEDCQLECPSPTVCPTSHLQTFLWWLARRGVRPISQQTYYRSLRVFFRWLVHEGFRDDTPTSKVPMPKANEPLPRTVTQEHFLAAIATLNPKKFCDLRNLALFVMALDTGARLSELLTLRVGQLDLQNRCAKVVGKGNRERVIVFGQQTTSLLLRYLTMRSVKLGSCSNETFVFVYANGAPLDARYVNRAWHRAQERANLTPLPFHGLRHGFARVWLLRGGDAISLQILLGHKSPAMTRRYVTLWGTDLQRLHAQVSPIDKLKLPQHLRVRSQ